MLKNYLKIALRSLLKYKLNSFINIFGLGTGFAASLLIYLFARNELTYDGFHKNAQSIYLIYKERITPTGTQITRDTWLPMAQSLKNDYPAITNAVRLWGGNDWVEVGEQRFQENIGYADPALFQVFTFPLAQGDAATVFSDVHSAVVSEEIARKYFAEQDPIGKRITIGYTTDYVIRGVLKDIPQNSQIQISILVPAVSAPFYEENKNDWGSSFLSTFIQLSPGTAPAELEAQFPNFVSKTWNEELNKSMKLKLTPLLELYNEITGAHTYAYILLGVAMIIMLIATINFMNLTTARSVERAREIGMRKVLGALRRELVKQFLQESLLMSLLALVLGLCLLEIVLPWFNSLYGLELHTDYVNHPQNILGLFSLAVIVGLLSGCYPAFVLSRYQPGEALKGKLKSKPAGLRLRYGLVVAQFCLAMIMMIGTGVMWRQIQFMKNANLNFDKENIVAIPVQVSDFKNQEQARVRLETFRNELRQHNSIQSVASSIQVPGRWPSSFTFAYPTDRDDSQRLRVRRALVDAHFFDTYGMRLVEGRNFAEQSATDAQQSLILNEAALRDLGWPNAVGRQIRVGETVYTVIGVIKDYNFASLANAVAPVLHFYRPSDSDAHRVISVKLAAGNVAAALDHMRDKWRALDSGRPLDFFFVDDNFNLLYQGETRLSTVTSAFAILAILIAGLGLFGLSSLMVAQRTKEIGIRKTLGASIANLVFLVTKVFNRLVILAFMLACPLAYFAAKSWLQDFAYHVDIEWEIFALAGVLALVVALLTISFQSIKAALANPVEALRYE
ncbi:MAG: ABC transporter permease [bacterium]